jgi:hypothetical protein
MNVASMQEKYNEATSVSENLKARNRVNIGKGVTKTTTTTMTTAAAAAAATTTKTTTTTITTTITTTSSEGKAKGLRNQQAKPDRTLPKNKSNIRIPDREQGACLLRENAISEKKCDQESSRKELKI